MNPGSLRLRLLLGAGLAIFAALAVAFASTPAMAGDPLVPVDPRLSHGGRPRGVEGGFGALSGWKG